MSGLLDPATPTPSDNVLVGRATEREAIDALLGAADHGASGSLVLAGPRGIGKSALARYAIDRAARFRVLDVVGVESEMAFGYAGVHQLVLPIADRIQRLPSPQGAVLDAVLAGTQPDPVDPFLVGLAVLTLLAESARSQPVLVVVDDAHFLDDESVMALSFVGRRLRAERLAMLVTLHETSGTHVRFEGVRRVDLAGLPDPEALELLNTAAPGRVDEHVASRLVAASEGNPLALVELPAALTVEQLRGIEPLPEPLPIGDRLSGLFTTRTRALDADARSVLLLAAAERTGDPVLLRRAADARGERWDEAVTKAEASGLVTFAPTVHFRHPLVRSAVYYSAAAADRRRAHAALADALDDGVDVDRHAWHLGAAAARPDERVAQALEASAERARQRGGSAAAATYLCRAAELTPDRQRAATRLLEAARAELTAGRGPQARELLDRARATGLAAEHDADAAWTESLIHLVAGNVRETTLLLARALGRIEAGNAELAVGVCVAAAAAALAAGHLVEGPTPQTIADGTLTVVERGDVRDPLATLVNAVAVGLIDEHATATPMLHAAVTSATEDQERLQASAGRHIHVVYFATVFAAVDTLDDRAWDELTRTWVQVARATGALGALPIALSLRSWLEVLQGRPGSASSHLAEVEDIVSLTGWRGLLGKPAPAQVLRDAWRGDEDATRSGARRMMQDAHERGQGIGVDHAYAALTVLELGAGRYDAALRSARRIWDHGCVGVTTVALGDLVESAVRCGELDIARQALEGLSERALASGTAWAAGMLARAMALVATGDEADQLFRSALDELSRATVATETARTQLLYGEWLRRARRRKEAREPLRDALEFFETVGASGFAARARAELAATGERIRHGAAPVDVLTPQEAQIARLAASGERNLDIAAQLYITTSTVEYHLRKIFVKLGVSSRTQLAHVELPT